MVGRIGVERLVSQTGTMLFGGDYNPEQWPEEVWAEDMDLLKQAHINEVTLNVFSWASLQPSEDEYDFTKLDMIVETVSDAGMSIVMATSTGALPPWMSLRHPDVNRVGFDGKRFRHNGRHNACINSPTYKRYSVALAGRLAQRYADLPNLVGWHVSNEYGGFCWCDVCAQAFREWLRHEYHNDIEAVNQAWNTGFWSHTFHSFDEIFPPNALGDGGEGGDGARSRRVIFPGFSLDYRRFYGQAVLDSFRAEKAAIRAGDQMNPVTTNLMGTFNDYDYFDWRDDLDIVSWDSYPSPDTSSLEVAFRHELMRAVGGGHPFMLMEQTPSRQNWMPYNSQKRPGQMRQLSWQAIAHGADTVQFFQLRQSRSGAEKFHGAVIGSDGTDKTRVFHEVAELGAELERLSPQILGSVCEQAKVAIIFDWNSWWGIDFSVGPTVCLDYVHEVVRWFSELRSRGIAVDVISKKDSLDGYDVVLAPQLYMGDGETNQSLRDYVTSGGRLLLTTMSLLADQHDSLYQGEIPVPLRDLAGVWVEETDALAPGHNVRVDFADMSGEEEDASATILADVLRLDEGTQTLASYQGEYYAKTPALTFKGSYEDGSSQHNGGVMYCAFIPDDEALRLTVDFLLDGLRGVKAMYSAGGVGDAAVEVTHRVKSNGQSLTFVINSAGSLTAVPSPVAGRDLLTGTEFAQGVSLELGPYGVVVLLSDAQ